MVGLLHLQLFHQHGRKEERGIELRSDKPCLSIQDSTGSQHRFSGGCGLEITQSRGLGWVHFLYQFKDRQGKSEASQVASDGSHALQTELVIEGRRLSGCRAVHMEAHSEDPPRSRREEVKKPVFPGDLGV